MLWAAAFFALLRVGEFTSQSINKFDRNVDLSVSDISVDEARPLSIHTPEAVQRKGVLIVLGKTNQCPLCPVSALLSYLVARGKAPGPLLMWSNGQFLSRVQFVREVRKALELAGEDSF